MIGWLTNRTADLGDDYRDLGGAGLGSSSGVAARRRVRSAAAIAFALVAALFCTAAQAQERALRGVALVIGQSDYRHIAPLANPLHDAREVAKLLTDLGFDARSVTDRDAQRLRRDLERLVEDAEDADVALLYYAGHGIEAGGENWLVPVDADEASLDSALERLVPLSEVLDGLRSAVPVTIVLLDACRTNPFPPGSLVRPAPGAEPAPMGESGLTAVRGAAALRPRHQVPIDNLGTVIGFAAEPGLPALDGPAGANSPYASALLRHLSAMPGIEFGAVMRMITEEVYLATRTRQRPWVNETLRRQLFFGMPEPAADGEEGAITGERRQLLLTIAELPSLERVQVEQVAARDGVPLDALYGVLRAMGETAQPDDPEELGRLLDAQAERLRKMLSERAALRTDDPEIVRLTSAADRAIGEGAIQTARRFMDEAVQRIEDGRQDVDDLEELVRQKRIADAAIYARRADAAALAFAFLDAAEDYGRAHDLVSRWHDDLAWNYKNQEAEALRSHGEATGDREALSRSLAAYEQILGMLPPGERGRDWAITRNNMAVVLHTLGERAEDTADLQRSIAMAEESMAVFAELDDDANWSAAQNNIGNLLLAMGMRESNPVKLEQAVEAFRAALARRDREAVPLDWAASQNNLGIALYNLSDRRTDLSLLDDAEVAYRAALEVLTPATAPIDWAMVQNNLGNALNALGLRHNDGSYHRQAAEAFEAAMRVRTRESWPLQWAASQLNLGNAYNGMARHELGTLNLDRARQAYEAALEVFTRERAPLEWASVQNNLGSVMQTLGQRGFAIADLEASVDAFEAAREVYSRDAFPLDWAMTYHNMGNTLQLMGGISGDAGYYRAAVEAFETALGEFRRDVAPVQWAFSTSAMGATLQSLAANEEGTESLVRAITARRAALEVLTIDIAPVEWANAQAGLGMLLLNLTHHDGNLDNLRDARAAFEALALVYTREALPLQWAFAQNNIGDVHWSTAAYGGGAPEYSAALAHFESAREEFERLGYAMLVDLTDQKIELIRSALGQE